MRVSSAASTRTPCSRSSGSSIAATALALGRVGALEEAALLERRVEDPLKPRRRVGDDLLRVREAPLLPEPLDGCVDLRGCEALAGRPRACRLPAATDARACGRSAPAARAARRRRCRRAGPTAPAVGARLLDGERHQQQHRGEHAGADDVAVGVLARGAGRAAGASPRRRSSPAPRRWRRPRRDRLERRPRRAMPPMPPSDEQQQRRERAVARARAARRTARSRATHVGRVPEVLGRRTAPSRRATTRRRAARTPRRRTAGRPPVSDRADGAQRSRARSTRPGRCERIGPDAGDLARVQARQARRAGAPRAARRRERSTRLELRRPLAQARTAVRALGDEARHLGPAVLADDEEVGRLRHCRLIVLRRRGRRSASAQPGTGASATQGRRVSPRPWRRRSRA